MSFPPYSLLLSVYYKENPEWFRVCLNSVLEQSVKPSEIVLVEDGPLTPELNQVVSEYSLIFQNFKVVALPENRGLGLALQKGISHCTNELIGRMDTDDISASNRFERQLQKFIENPTLDIVGCWENEFWGESTTNVFSCHKVPEFHEKIMNFMRYRCALLHPTVLFRKTAVIRAGNYQHRPLFEDYDLFVRMLQTGSRAYNIQEGLYFLRVNPNLFMRRGGFSYAKTLLQFKYELWRNGFFTFSNFLVSGIGHFIICLLPNRLRIMFYKLFLR